MPGRERPALFGHRHRLGISVFHNEPHQLTTQFDGFFRVVRNTEKNEHVGEAHQAESQFTGGLCHFLDCVYCVLVRIDHVVEHASGNANCCGEAVPIDTGCTCLVDFDELCNIDRAEVA